MYQLVLRHHVVVGILIAIFIEHFTKKFLGAREQLQLLVRKPEIQM